MKLMKLTLDSVGRHHGGALPVLVNPMHVKSVFERWLGGVEIKYDEVIGSYVVFGGRALHMDEVSTCEPFKSTVLDVEELPEEVARRFEEATR